MTSAPAWHAQVHEMHARGMTPREIGAALNRDYKYVRDILTPDVLKLRREKARLRDQERKAAAREAAKAKQAKKPKPDTLEIARRYNAGEFDRQQMMRILRGEIRI